MPEALTQIPLTSFNGKRCFEAVEGETQLHIAHRTTRAVTPHNTHHLRQALA